MKKKKASPSSQRRRASKIKKGKKVKMVSKKRVPKEKSEPFTLHRTRIRVIGIGGGGSSIVSEIAPQLRKVNFVVANTDLQALEKDSKKARAFHFGSKITRGLGCGMDPRLGQKAALDERKKITKLFQGVDLCILAACLGGGTGSGASPEFARIARENGALTFGIFTLPFKFEGGKKAQIAKNALEKIIPYLNALVIIPNQRIFRLIDKKTPIREAFSAINKILAENLRGLIEMIYLPGLINIDFADLRAVLIGKEKLAYLNTVRAEGSDRSRKAVEEVLRSPLQEYSIRGAENILFNITSSRDFLMKEVEEISRNIYEFNPRAKIVFGLSQDQKYNGRIRITLLAVGCGKASEDRSKSKEERGERRVEEKKDEKRGEKKKEKKKVKKKVKKKEEANPNPSPPVPLRRNALELKKQQEQTEQEILAEEEKWDPPAFLRKNN